MIDYAKTKEDWWNIVNIYWKSLESLILNYYPNQENFPKDGYELPEKGLRHPQAACNVVIKKLRKENNILTKGNLKEFINRLKKNQDTKLDNIFQSTWFGMPECASIREKKGFFVFCDLCSESHVLYEVE